MGFRCRVKIRIRNFMVWIRIMVSVCVCTLRTMDYDMIVLLDRVSVFVSSVILYSSLPGVEVNKKLHWNPGEPVSLCV